MKYTQLLLILIALTIISCGNTSTAEQPNTKEPTVEEPTFQNKGHKLVYQMVEKVGNYAALRSKNDITYTYTYKTPDGKTDVSSEKYIIDGELSYAKYLKHQRTFPELKGEIEQGYDGSEFWFKHNGKELIESVYLDKTKFNRKTNYYWFMMFQKLLDPGLVYDYVEEKVVNGTTYDVVRVSFASKDNTPTDIYQVYINRKTGLIDKFLFTVADFGVMETPLLMEVKYETVDGIMIPTQRRYKKSTWDAEVTNKPWIAVTWSNIKFDNGLKVEDFKK